MARMPNRTTHVAGATNGAQRRELPLVNEKGKDFYMKINAPTELEELRLLALRKVEILEQVAQRARQRFTAPQGFEVVAVYKFGQISLTCARVEHAASKSSAEAITI